MRWLSLALLLCACDEECFLGDPLLAPEIELYVLGLDPRPAAVVDGDRVPLIQAPQGGKHIFAGFRARNLDMCPVAITGVVRDTSTGQVRFERRPVVFRDGGDGWAYPREPDQISSYANIAVCPNSWATKDIFEQSFELELTARDREGRTVTVTRVVTPYCAQPEREADCLCSCAQGYVMERQCPGTR
jgi:hypothetical protein